jgi:ribose-phosphate pyrophosphokinase
MKQEAGLRLFALGTSRDYGAKVARHLGIELAAHEERDFEDGEHKARPLESVRGADVFVIASLFGDAALTVNDKLVRLLFFLGAVRDAGAGRVTAVIPYLCYARKDRKTKSRDPVNTRYTAALLEAVGVDAVLTVDVHNLAAYQNAFRCHSEHLEARPLFVDHFSGQLAQDEQVVVVSPDIGGVKRAEQFREALARHLGRPVDSAFMEKKRSAGVVSGEAVVGEVAGRTAIIVDDMIAGGTTLARTVEACQARGARRILAAATHGLFVADAEARLAQPGLERLVITDSVAPFRLSDEFIASRLTVLDGSAQVAEAIRRLHDNGSIVELLAD